MATSLAVTCIETYLYTLYNLLLMTAKSFVFSNSPGPHASRAKQILQKHPDVRNLIGKNPNTIYIIIGVVLFQISMACLVANQSWWMVFAAAYLLGAFADHALFVMIHECTHRLLFKRVAADRFAGILANLPQIFPTAISFEYYHIKHHSGMGVPDQDGDLPDEWEARLIDNYFIGKALWLLLYPFFQLVRLPRLRGIKTFDKWIALNWLVQIAFTATVFIVLGPKALVFLLASFFFSVGLHPLGARWIQEHFLTNGNEQETHSYYGGLNTIAFNVGYHNEHHDFPSVPWNKLPEVKKIAPNFYDNLFYHTSWTKLFLRFLFDKEISLYSRIVRSNRTKPKPLDKDCTNATFCEQEADVVNQ